MSARILLTLALTLPGLAHGSECGRAALEAFENEEYEVASALYAAAAERPACAAQRADLLWSAATTAQRAAKDGTPHERCAVSQMFADVTFAPATADQMARAARERDAWSGFCELAAAASPDRVIGDAMPQPLPAFVAQSEPALDTGEAIMLGAAGAAAVGAAVAYATLWVADDDRDSAQRAAQDARDEVSYARARDDYAAADRRAFTAGVTAYSLLGVSLTLVGTWVAQSALDAGPGATPVTRVASNRVSE